MPSKFSVLFTLLFLILPFMNLSADSSGEIAVLIAEKKGVDSLHQSFINIINDSIDLELQIEDFQSIPHPSSFLKEMYGIAASKGASYIIDSDLILKSDTIQFTLSAYRVADQMPVHQESGKHKIDLDLDQSVRVTASILVNAIKADSRINRDLLITFAAEDKIDGTLESAGGDESDDAQVPAEPEKKEETEVGDSEKSPESSRDMGAFKKFYFSAGFAPFMTTGDASQYFTMGMAPEGHLSRRFKIPSGYLSLGVFGSWNMIEASGVLYDSKINFISAGPELRYGAYINQTMDLYFSMGGGMTLFRMDRDEDGIEQTFVPYAAGGLGLNFNFSSFMGLYISSTFFVYFEESITITGFLPAIGIHFRV